ncbi:hypothetical protein MMC07_003828 [Pseudocyphellaria aurata]|nr:hypothetical protein [Pseudocyphellaria aurata]
MQNSDVSVKRNIMRFVELHARYQKNLIFILSKVQSQDGDGRLTSDPDHGDFKIENIRELLGPVSYRLFEKEVLNLENIVKGMARSVEGNEHWIEDYWPKVYSKIEEIRKEIWKQFTYKATHEEKDLQLQLKRAIETAMDPEKKYSKTSGRSSLVWKLSSRENYQDELFDPLDNVTWKLNDTETSNLFSDLESSIQALEDIADTVRPKQEISLDFTNETIVKCWRLDPKESGTSNALSNLSSNDALPRSRIFESLLGGYQRDQVPLNEIQPGGQYRGICKLQTRFQNRRKGSGGSGWLLDSSTVVTAAHCVYDFREKKFAVKVVVHIGRHTQKNTAINTKKEHRLGASVAINWGYYVSQKTQYDIAVIKLDRPFNDASPVAWQDCPPLVNKPTVRVVGYPGDLPEGANKSEQGHDMYVSECQIQASYRLRDNNFELEYMLDTWNGNSGGPILEVASDGTFKSIGVHCSGGAWNPGSALGHVGNHLLAFQKALGRISDLDYIAAAGGDDNTRQIAISLLASQVSMKSDMHTEGRKA